MSTAEAGPDVRPEVLQWLLSSPEPAVRHLTRREFGLQDLGCDGDATPDGAQDDVSDGAPVGGADTGAAGAADRTADGVLDGPLVRGLLAGQRADGGFGCHPYRKWAGAHWRLVSLVELGIPEGEPHAAAAARTVLDWLSGRQRRGQIVVVDGRVRACGSIEGNALAVCSRLGVADERVRRLAESLMEWQWPDGGWNCDKKAGGHRSSFHESLPPMWGLWEYHLRTGDPEARRAAFRTAGMLLDHGLFRSRTGAVIDERWTAPRWPPYWHYDILQALLILSRMGVAGDPRAREARQVLRDRRGADGRWRAAARWWRPPGPGLVGGMEAVDWGRIVPGQMVTLNVLRVLRSGQLPEQQDR